MNKMNWMQKKCARASERVRENVESEGALRIWRVRKRKD